MVVVAVGAKAGLEALAPAAEDTAVLVRSDRTLPLSTPEAITP